MREAVLLARSNEVSSGFMQKEPAFSVKLNNVEAAQHEEAMTAATNVPANLPRPKDSTKAAGWPWGAFKPRATLRTKKAMMRTAVNFTGAKKQASSTDGQRAIFS